jgi:hypothetical protein
VGLAAVRDKEGNIVRVKIESAVDCTSEEEKVCSSPCSVTYYVRRDSCGVLPQLYCLLLSCWKKVLLHECRCDPRHHLSDCHSDQNLNTINNAVRSRPDTNMRPSERINIRASPVNPVITSRVHDHARSYNIRVPDLPWNEEVMAMISSTRLPHPDHFPYRKIHTKVHMQVIEASLKRIWQQQIIDYESELRRDKEIWLGSLQERNRRKRSCRRDIYAASPEYRAPELPSFVVSLELYSHIHLFDSPPQNPLCPEHWTRFTISCAEDPLQQKVIRFVHMHTPTPPYSRRCSNKLEKKMTAHAVPKRSNGTAIETLRVSTQHPYMILIYSDHNVNDFRTLVREP